jgi:hypothetical protein
MSDEFDVALQMPSTSSGAEATLVTSRGTAAPRSGDDPLVPPPDSTTALREQRTISDATRKAIARIAEMGKKADTTVDVGDELVPMEHEAAAAPAKVSPAAAAERQARAAAQPTASPQAPAAAQTPAPAPALEQPAAAPQAAQSAAQAAEIMARAEAERLRSEHEQRVKDLEAREARLAEREKLLPDRTALAERPGAALASILRNALGLSDNDADKAELKAAISDLVTEASMEHLGVDLPDEVKTKLEARRALRSVKAYKQDQERREAELTKQREAQLKADRDAAEQRDAADREAKAIKLVGELVGGTRETHPFLHAAGELGLTDPTSVVVDLIRAQRARGEQADWQAAVKLANDHFRPKVEAAVKKSATLSTLLNPAAPAPVAAAAAAPATQQVGEQVRRPTTLTTTPTAPASPETGTDDGLEIEDRYDRRHRTLRSLYAKHRSRFPSAEG